MERHRNRKMSDALGNDPQSALVVMGQQEIAKAGILKLGYFLFL